MLGTVENSDVRRRVFPESTGRDVRAMFSGNRSTSSKVKMGRAGRGHVVISNACALSPPPFRRIDSKTSPVDHVSYFCI